MKENRSARRRGRAASGGCYAGQRDSQKLKSTWTNFQQALGAVTVYDGLDYCGAVIPHAGRWLAVNGVGRRIGIFDLRHQAERALYKAARPSGGA